MLNEQERGFKGRFVRSETAREQARLRAMAHFIGESALTVRPTGEELSSKELRTLLAIAQGRPAKDIAHTALAFSIPHLRKGTYAPIRQKLGARNMAHAVRLGFEDELIDPVAIDHSPVRELSDAQRDILELISLGAGKKDIAQIMGIAPGTVTGQVIDMKRRYGVETVEHATAVGLVSGDIPLRHAA